MKQIYSHKELEAVKNCGEIRCPHLRPLVKTEYNYINDEDFEPHITTKHIPYSTTELAKLKKEYSRLPQESETEYVFRVSLTGGDQIKLTEHEASGYRGHGVFLTTGNKHIPWSLTQFAAYWAGGLSALERGDPLAIIGGPDQLLENIHKAACLQMIHERKLISGYESPKQLPVKPELMTPLIRGLPESLKPTAITLQKTIMALGPVERLDRFLGNPSNQTGSTDPGFVPYSIPSQLPASQSDSSAGDHKVWTGNQLAAGLINYSKKYGPVKTLEDTSIRLSQGYNHSLTLAQDAQELENIPIGHNAAVYQYIDDILVGGDEIEEVGDVQQKIISHLESLNLQVASEKIEKASQEVKLFGIWWKGAMTCIPPDTLTSLDQIKMPESRKDLQQALGLLVFWRKHLPDFSIIARPLYGLLRKGVKWDWIPAQEEAMHLLIFEVTAYQALGPIHPTDPFQDLIEILKKIKKDGQKTLTTVHHNVKEIHCVIERSDYIQAKLQRQCWNTCFRKMKHFNSHWTPLPDKFLSIGQPTKFSIRKPKWSHKSILTWKDPQTQQWKADVAEVEGSPQVAELAAVVRAFERFSEPFNLVTDSAYVVGVVSRAEQAILQEVSYIALFKLPSKLVKLVSHREQPFYVIHTRSHTDLPGFIVEGNRRADALAALAAMAPLPNIFEQAKLSCKLFHQNAPGPVRRFHLTWEQAKVTVAKCPSCSQHALPTLSVVVNLRGLKSCEVWQTDVTHFPEFGKSKYVHVSVNNFSGAALASAHTEEKSSDTIKHLVQTFSFMASRESSKPTTAWRTAPGNSAASCSNGEWSIRPASPTPRQVKPWLRGPTETSKGSSINKNKELSMETREDKSPRQILVEEAVLGGSTGQESNREERTLRSLVRETAKADHEDLRRKEPPCARKAARDGARAQTWWSMSSFMMGRIPTSDWSVERASARVLPKITPNWPKISATTTETETETKISTRTGTSTKTQTDTGSEPGTKSGAALGPALRPTLGPEPTPENRHRHCSGSRINTRTRTNDRTETSTAQAPRLRLRPRLKLATELELGPRLRPRPAPEPAPRLAPLWYWDENEIGTESTPGPRQAVVPTLGPALIRDRD
ncbi:hypothetical protein DUI87_26539 [Hirundo rustica rustica]|uniref:RNA-directed DNA polymerase n=1 Tax=Hirundo rustica rustica TaxID=333673 RepID=A0A3M0J9M9_HIRRU|nr:hypothetical protein DUI87_26539 [Hirundo rustica rustica]